MGKPALDASRAVWRKSTRSNGNSGNCVEVCDNLPGAVAVRDSKDRSGPILVFGSDSWRAFVRDVKSGTLDN
jgi:Domain of unknown function (DUF397)